MQLLGSSLAPAERGGCFWRPGGSLLAPPGQGSASSRAPRAGHVSGWGTWVAKGSCSPGKCKWQSAALAVPSTESAAGLGEDGSSSPLPSRSLHLQPSSPVIARRPLWVTIHKPGRIHGGSDLSPGITPARARRCGSVLRPAAARGAGGEPCWGSWSPSEQLLLLPSGPTCGSAQLGMARQPEQHPGVSHPHRELRQG